MVDRRMMLMRCNAMQYDTVNIVHSRIHTYDDFCTYLKVGM